MQQKGSIKSFDAVFLTPHGGDLNGFILIRCEPNQLDAVMPSSELVIHVTRGAILLDGPSVIRGVTGEMIKEQPNLLKGLLPPQ